MSSTTTPQDPQTGQGATPAAAQAPGAGWGQESRLQLALNVDDLDTAVAFYSALFGAEPAKLRPGYANFALAQPALKLVLIENPGRGGSVNHLGVEVPDVEAVGSVRTAVGARGLATTEPAATTCCYARQDKFYVDGPSTGERWEVYTVLADSSTFGDPPPTGCDCGTATDAG